MRLFYALSAAMGFVVMGADCTNAYANSPSPTQSTYVRIDDAYADWYRSCHGKEVDRSFVLPVLKALQGHPEAGALWEKHINKILDDLDIVYTTHERSIYRGTIDGKIVLLCRQVDDIAVACSDPTVAQGLIDSIGKVVDLKSQGILSSFNGIDIDQRREYVKISCQSYLTRMLKTHGWAKASPTEKSDSKPIEPLAASTAEELSTSVGPAEDSAEHRALEKEMGFGYRQVLGELTYAYVVGRVDISYAVTLLARYSSAPDRCHYLALKRLCKYLRRTIDWGILYWRQAPCELLPAGDFKTLSVDNKDLPAFPKFSNLLELVGYVDAAHATDLCTRRSVTGLSFCLAGGAIAFKSKLQPTVATSSTESEFIAAVLAAKIAKYLRSILIELGFPPSGPTLLYEDNKAAINMVNANRPTERSRHIDIQYFAIQEWRQRGDIKLAHIPGVINPADAQTKPLGWILHHRHVRRIMGHHGPCTI
jgi:hypothetical protein